MTPITMRKGDNMDFDDFDWEDGVVIGSFFDYMIDQEELEGRKRRRKDMDETDTEEDIDDYQEPC